MSSSPVSPIWALRSAAGPTAVARGFTARQRKKVEPRAGQKRLHLEEPPLVLPSCAHEEDPLDVADSFPKRLGSRTKQLLRLLLLDPQPLHQCLEIGVLPANEEVVAALVEDPSFGKRNVFQQKLALQHVTQADEARRFPDDLLQALVPQNRSHRLDSVEPHHLVAESPQ